MPRLKPAAKAVIVALVVGAAGYGASVYIDSRPRAENPAPVRQEDSETSPRNAQPPTPQQPSRDGDSVQSSSKISRAPEPNDASDSDRQDQAPDAGMDALLKRQK